VYSAIFTGAAGAIFAHYLIVASPEFFGFSFSTLFLSMVLVGGSGTIYGAIVAGVILTFISELLAALGPVRFMVVAVIIILTIRFSPQGVWGLAKRYFSRTRKSVVYPSEEILITTSESQDVVQNPEQEHIPPPASGY
jgi:branched-chain amino acid transport system permease protein